MQIKGRGTILFQCLNNEHLVLSEVYYIPRLCSNIVSIGQLGETKFETSIRRGLLQPRDPGGELKTCLGYLIKSWISRNEFPKSLKIQFIAFFYERVYTQGIRKKKRVYTQGDVSALVEWPQVAAGGKVDGQRWCTS